jgi:hypothetical protein
MDMVFAFDNNHYDGCCSLMTRGEYDAWRQASIEEEDGAHPLIVPVDWVIGGAEALAAGETRGGFYIREEE